jgi:CRISPR-associated protein Csb2
VTSLAWDELHTRLTAELSKRTKKEALLIQATLPARLADALAVDTAQWHAAGWSNPPPLVKMVYDRPHVGPLPPRRREHKVSIATSQSLNPNVARFLLAGKPRPPIEDAIKIGELMRLAALAQFGRDERGRWRAPSVISGRDADGRHLAQGVHGHAFYLPEDSDADGFIDHVVVFAKSGLTDEVQSKLDRVTRLWEPGRIVGEDDAPHGRKEWRLALEGFGRAADFADSMILGRSRRWRSVTPYLMPWHAKKNFGLAEQIRREIGRRKLLTQGDVSAVTAEPLPELRFKGRALRPIHFHRFRSRRNFVQPDTTGRFVVLEANTEIEGPLALGFGCHFGLGLFAASD